jgi:hypothetical protein
VTTRNQTGPIPPVPEIVATRTVTAKGCPLYLDRAVFLPDLARDPGAVWAIRERFFTFFGWA